MLASICLWLFHLFYHFATSITTFRKPFDRHTSQPLNAKRAKIPSHLALLLVANNIADREAVEATLVESVLKAVKWCRVVGIKQLTVYDADGMFYAPITQGSAWLKKLHRRCRGVFSRDMWPLNRGRIALRRGQRLRASVSINAPAFRGIRVATQVSRIWGSARCHHLWSLRTSLPQNKPVKKAYERFEATQT